MIQKPNFSLIAACDIKMGIGKNNKLPWNIPNEIKFFKEITTNNNKENYVIMGYNTWNSIPNNFKPLKHRTNIILTKNEDKQKLLYMKYNNSKEIECFCNIDKLFEFAYDKCNEKNKKKPLFWIIGGENIYYQFLSNTKYKNYINNIILTRIDKDYHCDTFLSIDDDFLKNNYSKLRETKNIMYDKNTCNNVNIKFESFIKK
jgi:dihydrofolate reductase